MNAAPHTEGPWRWEFNREHKTMRLVGGRPQFDLTIMDFERWGMRGAVASLRDTAHDGMNIMHRLCDRTDWIAPFPGRAHHASWCAGVTHPDIRLMAAAPKMLKALQDIVRRDADGWKMSDEEINQAKAAIAEATGAAA